MRRRVANFYHSDEDDKLLVGFGDTVKIHLFGESDSVVLFLPYPLARELSQQLSEQFFPNCHREREESCTPSASA